jgi:hypothetical protein
VHTLVELDRPIMKHLRIYGGRGNARLPHASSQDQRMWALWGTDDMDSQMGWNKRQKDRQTDRQTVLLQGSDWLYQCRGINFQRSKHVNNNKKYFTSLFLSLLGGEKRQVIPPAVDTLLVCAMPRLDYQIHCLSCRLDSETAGWPGG